VMEVEGMTSMLVSCIVTLCGLAGRYVRFEVLTAASMKISVFWDVAPCSLVVCQRFRGACCLHRQGDASTSETSVNFYQTTRRNIPEDRHLLVCRCVFFFPKRWYLLTSQHGLTTQKTNIDIFTVVRTSNLTQNE
jgi:hypothetical protein